MLIKRNMLLYFRDRQNVFYSMFAVFLMLGLYLLFLSGMMENNLRAAMGVGEDFNTGSVMTGIVLAGMVATTSVTSGLVGIVRFVADKESAAWDFFTTPISRRNILFSYVIGAALIGLIMTVVALFISVGYLALNGNNVLNPRSVGLLFITAVLNALCANALVFLLTSIAKTREAFSSLNTIVSSLIGFLMGVFIPIGNMPDAVAWVLRLFPLNHGASMFRQVLAGDALYNLFYTVNAPAEYHEQFRLFFGVALQYGDFTSNFWFSAAVLAVSAVVFYGISLAIMSKNKALLR